MRILILGCGYVGSALAKRWQAEHEISVTTTREERLEDLQKISHRVWVLKGNEKDKMAACLAGQDVVVITVAPTVTQESADKFEHTYLQTAKTMSALLPNHPRVRQLIYTSSCSVYSGKGQAVDETYPIDAESPTKKILFETENSFLSLSPHLKVSIFRLGQIYGSAPRTLAHFISMIAGRTLPGTGNACTNLIHLDDIVGAIDFAVRNEVEGIFNLTNDTHLPRKEFYDHLCRKHGATRIQFDPQKSGFERSNVQCTNQKIKSAGYVFIHPETVY